MSREHKKEQGFTLVELIAVMVIIGVMGAALSSRMVPQAAQQLQAGRDFLISAFFVAQQKAMHQNRSVRLTTVGAVVDIRLDSNADGAFTSDESILSASGRYPINLEGGVLLSAAQFEFDSFGYTSPGSIQLNKGGREVTVTISGTGYAY